MTLELDLARTIFGTMLTNAQALEDLLTRAQLQLPPTDTDTFARTLQHIHQLTVEQAAMLQELRLEHGANRRHSQRRSGADRRQG